MFIVLMQMHFIQRKQFSQTNVTLHGPSTIIRFEDFSGMRHMRPAGL